MNRSKWTFAVAFGMLSVGLTVGALAFLETPRASAEPEPEAEALPTALDWMPETSGLVGHIDFKSVAASPLADAWSQEAWEATSPEDLGPVEEIRESTGVDLWNDVESLTFSVGAPSPSKPAATSDEAGRKLPFEAWGMAISGTFDADRLLEKARARDRTVSQETYGGKAVYRVDGKGEQDIAFAMASDSLLLLGSPDYIREMIDSGEGRKPSASRLVESWGYGKLEGDSFWIAGKPNGTVDSVLGGAGNGPALRSFALSGRLSTDLSVNARGKASDAEAAQKLADVLRGLIALGRLQQGGNPQMAALADAISIELAGDEIHVDLAVPYETIRALFDQRRKAAIDR
jgi:hypothetical protein